MIATFHEVRGDLAEATLWWVKLEWPKKVARLFEMFPNSVDFMHKILHADDAKPAQLFLNDGVVV